MKKVSNEIAKEFNDNKLRYFKICIQASDSGLDDS